MHFDAAAAPRRGRRTTCPACAVAFFPGPALACHCASVSGLHAATRARARLAGGARRARRCVGVGAFFCRPKRAAPRGGCLSLLAITQRTTPCEPNPLRPGPPGPQLFASAASPRSARSSFPAPITPRASLSWRRPPSLPPTPTGYIRSGKGAPPACAGGRACPPPTPHTSTPLRLYTTRRPVPSLPAPGRIRRRTATAAGRRRSPARKKQTGPSPASPHRGWPNRWRASCRSPSRPHRTMCRARSPSEPLSQFPGATAPYPAGPAGGSAMSGRAAGRCAPCRRRGGFRAVAPCCLHGPAPRALGAGGAR
jgi:hypothetical protein